MFGSTAKPLASLSSGLLARKGQARPAMRPQGGFGSLAHAGDQLGWNDMGSSEPVAAPPAMPPVVPPAAPVAEATPQPVSPPAVLVEREALARELEAPRSVSVATAKRLQTETARKGRAAFTLRLDEERHLRLRLASATRHRSAQQLVVQALDAFLATLPEVNELARQLPPRKGGTPS